MFNVEQARKSGYTDEEIADHLASTRKFDLAGAIKAGYSYGDVVEHLSNITQSEETKSNVKPEIKSKKPGWIEPAGIALEAGATLVGGLIGAPLGPLGAGAGAGLGYAGARQIRRRGEELLGYTEPQALLEAAKEAAIDIPTGAAMEYGGQLIGPVLSYGRKGLKASDKAIDRLIDWGIEKGLRPTVVGKHTYPQIQKYMENARTAVKTIVSNKGALEFMDESGNIIKGELPKNLKQFGQAIDVNKREIFKQYNALAGATKGKVELKPIADELSVVGQSNELKDLFPDIVKYAEKKASALLKRGTYTTEEAQNAIAALNNSLEAFYKNPSYQNASKAQIDSMIVNKMRKSLDDVIEKSVGEGYQELKNAYGALKSIEKEVNHRAIVDARKNVKGLIDFSDIFSGSQVVYGILQTNPSIIGAGATAKLISSLYRHWNSPNRTIKNMFSGIENLITRKPRISEPTAKTIGTLGGYVGLGNQMEE